MNDARTGTRGCRRDVPAVGAGNLVRFIGLGPRKEGPGGAVCGKPGSNKLEERLLERERPQFRCLNSLDER